MYGKTVMGVDGDRFEEALEHAKEAKGVRNDVELDEGDLRRLVEEFKGIIATRPARVPPGPHRAAHRRHRGRVRLLGQQAGDRLPA